MATAPVIGLSAGKRLLNSSLNYSDLSQKPSYGGIELHHPVASSKILIFAAPARRSSHFGHSVLSRPQIQSTNSHKEHLETAASNTSGLQPSLDGSFKHEDEKCFQINDHAVEALLLLRKSMLEKQWNLSTENARANACKRILVTSSGSSARCRRLDSQKHLRGKKISSGQLTLSRQLRPIIDLELLQNHSKGYVKGVISEELLPHNQVVLLSNIIKEGLCLEEHAARLRKRLGCEPSEEQLATSLKISRAELQSKFIECSLAREKLVMSNVRLVISIAQRYDNMGAEMADLIQGGLIGLLRGIEKYDASKGFKISTYVYWWIRQGVSRALVENSRTLRLPTHLHERLSLIRNAKFRLEERGITPSSDKIAQFLNMSQKKVRNATESICKVISLDREAFPSLNGLPGETLHSYIADDRLDNSPWHVVDELALKDEVNRLICATLRERERDIIRLYFGLDNECLTWEDISKRMGLSRERIRQVGLVALETLKCAARKSRMEAMLVTL